MSSQSAINTFNDLKSISTSQIAENISSKRAIEVTLKSIKENEVSTLETYKTWATSLFKNYGSSNISGSDIKQLLELFSLVVQQLLKDCGDCQQKEQVNKLHEFLNYSLELFTWIHSVAKEFDTNTITAFMCFGLAATKNYLVFLSKQTNRVNVRKLIEKSLAIHTLILGVLTEQSKTFFFSDNFTLLSNLISGLCGVGELTTKLDIKATVETWKCITRLASLNSSLKQTDVEANWLKRPMSFLISEIGRNVQTVYTQNCLSEPIEQIEKYLKVTNFYLKLLIKLATDFRHIAFPISEELVSTLVTVLNPPAYIANSPVNKVLVELIRNDLNELIPFAYRNDVFLEHLHNEHTANIYSKEAVLETVLAVIEVVILKSETEYINEPLLDTIFKMITESTRIYGSSRKYNRFVEMMSVFQTLSCSDQLQKKLVSIILQEDTLQALTAIDIWSSTFRLLNDSVRLSHLKFWKNINKSILQFSNRTPALHVELILKNLYKISMKTGTNLLPPRNERFLLAVGLESIPNCAEKQSVIEHLENELTNLLQCPTNPFTVDHYYMIIRKLKLLSGVHIQNDRLNEILLQYLEDSIQNRNLFLLSESILEFIGPKLGSIDGNRIFEILTALSTNISSFEEYSTKICVIGFLKNVAKITRFENQSKELLKAFESDGHVQLFGYMEEVRNSEDLTEKTNNLWKELIENTPLEKSERIHVCRTRVHAVSKKIEQTGIDILLESLEKTANNLQKQTESKPLNSANKEVIKRVVCKLQSIGSMSS